MPKPYILNILYQLDTHLLGNYVKHRSNMIFTPQSLLDQITLALNELDFTQLGVVPLTKPLSFNFYQEWIDKGFHGEMNYLKDHLNQKKNLEFFLPKANSTIVVTLDYFKHPKAKTLTSMKTASYSKGEDYHYFYKQKLLRAVEILSELFPKEHFKVSTDSQPILERDFAYQAGLGWFGKNTCLIHQKKGSYFLIGEIVTTLNIQKSEKRLETEDIGSNFTLTLNLENYHPDRCGTCTKCIDACPTQALTPKNLDANKCISYWTIESKNIAPLSLAQKFDSWFFGCDICQDVCPWNIKIHGLTSIKEKNESNRFEVLNEILDILKSSNKSLEKKFFGTPLSRARGFGLKRNALYVAMNMKATEIRQELEELKLNNSKLEELKNEILKLF